VAARPGAFNAAMMNDDDGAAEGLADGVGGCDVRRHVLVLGFRALQAAVEGVEDHDGG